MEKEILDLLKVMQQDIKNMHQENKEFRKEVNTRFDNIETDIKAIKEQTADLMEFKTEVKDKLERITRVLQENCFEITDLKALRRIK